MSQEVQKLTNELIDYARLVIVAMVLIVVIYLVAEALVGTVPAIIGSIIIGLAFAFIVVTNKKVRDAIKSWGK